MKRTLARLGIALALLTLATTAADLESSLVAISGYQFGDSKENLHAARLAAFRGANDDRVRRENERQLLAFIESDVSLHARREACLWLANLGTAASVPTLERLAADERFADVASIALAEVTGERATASAHASAPAIAAPSAMMGEDERAARMAFESIDATAHSAEARAWIATNLSKLPPHRQIVAMNVLLRANADESAGVIESLAISGHPDVRSSAIIALGSLGRVRDVPRFVEWLRSEGDEALQSAALAALVAAPESAVRDTLATWLRGGDAVLQAAAIEIAAQRGAGFAGADLLRIANDTANPNRKSAAAAVAWASMPDAFAEVIDLWIAAASGDMEAEWQAAAWILARRQHDYPTAIRTLESRAADAQPATRSAMLSMARRLESVVPQASLDQLRGR